MPLGEGDREQLVERPVQIGEEKMPLGAGKRALIAAFSHFDPLPRRARRGDGPDLELARQTELSRVSTSPDVS